MRKKSGRKELLEVEIVLFILIKKTFFIFIYNRKRKIYNMVFFSRHVSVYFIVVRPVVPYFTIYILTKYILTVDKL